MPLMHLNIDSKLPKNGICKQISLERGKTTFGEVFPKGAPRSGKVKNIQFEHFGGLVVLWPKDTNQHSFQKGVFHWKHPNLQEESNSNFLQNR